MKRILIILLLALRAFDLSAQQNDKELILKLLKKQRSDWNRVKLKPICKDM